MTMAVRTGNLLVRGWGKMRLDRFPSQPARGKPPGDGSRPARAGDLADALLEGLVGVGPALRQLHGLTQAQPRVGEWQAAQCLVEAALEDVAPLLQPDADCEGAEQFQVTVKATDVELKTLEQLGPGLRRGEGLDQPVQAGGTGGGDGPGRRARTRGPVFGHAVLGTRVPCQPNRRP